MKFFVASLIAALCVASVASSPLEAEERGIKDSILAVSKNIADAASSALQAAKGKAAEFSKILGQKKEEAIAQLKVLKDQLLAEAKIALAQAIDQAKQVAAQKLVEAINKQVEQLGNIKDQIEKLQ